MTKALLAALAFCSLAYAQFGTARRFETGATLPSVCAVGDTYYKTGASAGQYNCTSANTWSTPGPAGTASLTGTGGVVYDAAAGTLGVSTGFLRAGVGKYTLYDPTATTGATTLTIKAGAGQSTTRVLEVKGADGTVIGGAAVSAGPVLGFTARTFTDHSGLFQLGISSLEVGSGYFIRWSSGAGYSSTKDLALSRTGAGLLQVNSGTADMLRDLEVRNYFGGWGAGTEGGCNTYSDLAVDAVLNTKVTSASYTFVNADVKGWIDIAAGGAWAAGRYAIMSVADGAATLGSSPAVVGSTGGTYITNRGRIVYATGATDDTFRVCRLSSSSYGWGALF